MSHAEPRDPETLALERKMGLNYVVHGVVAIVAGIVAVTIGDLYFVATRVKFSCDRPRARAWPLLRRRIVGHWTVERAVP